MVESIPAIPLPLPQGVSSLIDSSNSGPQFIDDPPVLPPISTDVPSFMLGTVQEDETAIANTGGWINIPSSYAYQWKRDDTAITGETVYSYLVTSGDIGKKLSVDVTATNAIGSAMATSEKNDAAVLESDDE